MPAFSEDFSRELLTLFRWRRDVRRFRQTPVSDDRLTALWEAAALAPSVGLSQPWRFVLVEDRGRRAQVRAHFEDCNAAALRAQETGHAGLYARLKLAGLDEAPVQFAVFAEPEPDQGHGLGRLTMPETPAYSAVIAVHTLWLAARADGLGLGWVSILEPAIMAEILDVPAGWTFIGYFCLGEPSTEADTPELEREGWEHRRPAETHVLRR